MGPQFTTTLSNLATNRIPTTPSSDLVVCWNGSRDSGRLTSESQFVVKGITKDPGERPGEGLHRVRSGRVPSAGASVRVESGCPTLPVHGCVHHPGSSLNAVV